MLIQFARRLPPVRVVHELGPPSGGGVAPGFVVGTGSTWTPVSTSLVGDGFLAVKGRSDSPSGMEWK